MNNVNQLVKDLNSNSKKKSNNAEAELSNLAIIHLDKLEEIAHKFGKSWKNNSEYISGKGSLYYEDIYNETLSFRYKDYWQYGGKCDENISISISDLIEFNYEKYELDLKKQKIKELNNIIAGLELQIEKNKLELNKLL